VKRVGCSENEERDRGRAILVREKDVLESENDNYLGTNFEC
jgi:hypothetical protein